MSEDKQKEFECNECKNFKENYLNRTKVLDNTFLDWLDQEMKKKASADDAIMQSAMLLFSDYFKGIRHLRNKDMFIMCVTKYLRDKLFLKEDTVSEKIKKISEMNESVTDLKNELERLAVTYSKELIEKWYNSFKEWYDKQSVKDTYPLHYTINTCFYIEIKGVQIGCWSGKDNGNNNYLINKELANVLAKLGDSTDPREIVEVMRKSRLHIYCNGTNQSVIISNILRLFLRVYHMIMLMFNSSGNREEVID